MTTLDSILESNGFFDGCPAPLWKIKVNDEQYNSLKEYLVYRYSEDGNFNGCPKEAALLFSEWWKRDPGDSRETGEQYHKAVYASLGLPEDANAADNLYKNAKRIFDHSDSAHIPGAKLVITGHRREFLYSLFYQGGFPLGKASARGGSSWRNLIKKFVRKNYDFSDLKYGCV